MDFTLAKLAKSKGFNEPCTAKIDHRGEITHCEPDKTITNQFMYYSATGAIISISKIDTFIRNTVTYNYSFSYITLNKQIK